MKKLSIAIFAAILSGCASYHYADPSGRTVNVVKLGIKTEIGSFDAGTKEGDHLKMSGVSADGSESLKAAADALAKAADALSKLASPASPQINIGK